jgi:3-hydroxyacyl-[acyl-carrier-protein] dehydratase
MDLSLVSQAPLRLTVSFDRTDACFNEHFPGNPVVPGSLIAGLCMKVIADHRGRREPLRIRRFSFSRFASPGTYTLGIEEQDGTYLCTLRCDDTIFAQGRIAP